MPRARRTGVIPLTDRATSIQVTTPKAATKGQPCEHPLGCRTPWTTWTIRGGRCDDHPLTPAEIPVIRESEPWIRSHASGTLARARRRATRDEPHPFVQAPGGGRAICGCGLGVRAAIHRAEAAADGRDGD